MPVQSKPVCISYLGLKRLQYILSVKSTFFTWSLTPGIRKLTILKAELFKPMNDVITRKKHIRCIFRLKVRRSNEILTFPYVNNTLFVLYRRPEDSSKHYTKAISSSKQITTINKQLSRQLLILDRNIRLLVLRYNLAIQF